jgi:hypothetical protein
MPAASLVYDAIGPSKKGFEQASREKHLPPRLRKKFDEGVTE